MNSKCEAYSKVVIKSDTLQNLQFKNWCMLRKFFWNLTRYKMFNSISEAYLKIDAKSDTLENFSSKSDAMCFSYFGLWQALIVFQLEIWHVVSVQKRAFRISTRISKHGNFMDWNEPKRGILIANVFSISDMTKNF